MLSRRALLLAGGAAALGGLAWWGSRAWKLHRLSPGRFGPLRPDPAGLLDLPEGFAYRVLGRSGAPDAMACFALPDGTWALMRNQEISAGKGGVTRLVIDPGSLAVRRENAVLAGTSRNCAGGPSPWGWISCEESVTGGHGYAYLCDIHAETLAPPHRLDGMGRYNHEAAAVDARRGITYLSEDRLDGCLYRFVADDPVGAPLGAGRLEAMTVRGRPGFDLARGHAQGARFEIGWIPVEDATPAEDVVRARARAAGAARVCRGEGLWFDDGRVYLAATEGGPIGAGQIFRLAPEGDGGELHLLAQAHDRDLLELPDNLTVAPWGELVVCEDGPGTDHLRVVTAGGGVYDLARVVRSASELAGVCFSPDGRVLFVNAQQEGLTLAVTGPFPGV